MKEPNKNNKPMANTGTGASYLQEEIVSGKDGRVVSHITCYSCGKKGHYSDNCPQKDQQQQHAQMTEVSVKEKERGPINSDPEEEDQHMQIDDNDESVDDDDDLVIVHSYNGHRWPTRPDTWIRIFLSTPVLHFRCSRILIC